MTRTTFALLCALAVAPGCDRRATQADPPSRKAETPTELFGDGASARPLVTGTVPRPADASPGIPYVFVQSPGPVNMETTPTTMPLAVTDAMLARGQERFAVYCVACHDRTGGGNGAVVRRGFTHPPSFYERRLLDAPDAHFYDVITHGKGAMYSYDDRVAPDDRWAIVAYVRALQAAARQAPPDRRPADYGKTP